MPPTDALLQLIHDEEVKSAVFSMHPDNAPGPDVMLDGLNDTSLVLIPKKKNFAVIGDLRPISLCNVLYKIISKVLANHMRDLIDYIISETQSAFIPGRLISDNVMVTFEVMHYLKRKRRGKKGFMDLKLDMSKAYDRVEWSFLRVVMNRMGFASKWIDLIMGCVSTVRYKGVHNGHVLDSISPSRGIRQALEGSLYLGLSNIIGRNKNVVLGFLKNKVIARINSWDGKFLSRVGKEILLKTVIQSLPTYDMSVFLLPIRTCNEIKKLMASFWWKTNSSLGRGIIWMSWDRLATPKEEGGMGFRHLHDFNLAMLAKQGWQLLCKTDSLAGRVYKAKYFPNSDFITSDLGNNPSFVWRIIWGAKDLVRLGAARVIGDGRNTRILGTPWLPSTSNKYVSSTHPGLRTHTISSLFQPNMICWDADVVRDLFSPQEAYLILGIPLSNTGRPDCWSWIADHKRNFTVQSAYHLLHKKPVGLRPNNFGFWQVLATSSITLEHWRKAQDKSALLSLSFNNSDDGAELWTLPATNNLKINVDAALFQQDNSYDYGLVARDHFGKFLEAKTCQCNGNYPAEVVEALGIKEALS
uniref:Reverse transcriptase domain-containing protein n=1 Tax=Cannabis sativa TaxID=3483 RepID=A0A803Q5X6_CANSA